MISFRRMMTPLEAAKLAAQLSPGLRMEAKSEYAALLDALLKQALERGRYD